MAQKITHWLLITLILSLGFGQLLRFEFFGSTLYLHDILVLILLPLTFHRLHLTPALKLFLAGLLLGWSRALFIYPLISLAIPFLYTLRLLSYLLLYLNIKNLKLKLPPDAFLFSGLTTLILGLAQYLLLPDMRWAQYLGWDDHLNRLIMPHYDPTFTAIMLAIFILSFLPRYWYLNLFSTLAIFLTYSRSVILALVLTGCLFIKNRLALLLILCTVGLAILLLPKRFGEGTNLLRTFSISARLNSDLSYLKTYKLDLLSGRGLNTLVLDSPTGKYPSHATGPNNSYLFLLITTGVLGLLGFLQFFKDIYLTSRFKPLLVFILLASLFNNVLFYPFALLWILLIQFMVPTSA